MSIRLKKYSGAMTLFFAVLVFHSSYSFAHSGSISNAAWDACENKTKTTNCEYAGFHKERYIGTCQIMSEHMMCVRNQPIKQPDTSPVR